VVKAKFHYAIWYEAGSKLVRNGFEPVCDQLRTSFEPASVMEFGFNILETMQHRDVVASDRSVE